MTDRVATLLAFHETKGGFGTKANLIIRENEVYRLYKSLNPDELAALVEAILERAEEGHQVLGTVLGGLACFQPGSLDRYHERLVERHILYPGQSNVNSRKNLRLASRRRPRSRAL
jgi:hypothetical protein